MVGHIDANEIRYNNHNKSYYFSNDQLEMLTFIVKKSVHKGDKNSFKYKKEKEEMQQAFSALQNARSKLEKCANLNSMIFSSCNSPVIINEVAKETKKMQDEATKKIKDAVKVIEKNCSSYRSYLDISRIPNDLEHKVNNQKYKFVAEKSDLSYSKSIETTWNDFGIPYKNANALSEIAYSEFYEKAPKNKIKNEDVNIIEIEKSNSLLKQQIPENQKNKLKEALNAYVGLEKLQNELLECKRANNIINSNFYLDGAILESVIRNITKYGEKLQNEIVSYKEKVDRKYLPIIENANEINSTRKQEQRLDEINKKLEELKGENQSLENMKSNFENQIQVNKDKLDNISLQEELSKEYHEAHKETTTYHRGTGDEVTFENEYGPYYEYKYDGTEDKKEPRDKLKEASESLGVVKENIDELNSIVTHLEVEKKLIEEELAKTKEKYKKATFLEKLKNIKKNNKSQDTSIRM